MRQFKRYCLAVIWSVIVFAVPSHALALQSPAEFQQSPQSLISGLKNRIIENDPSVDQTISDLDAYFAKYPDDNNAARFLNIKSYYFIFRQDYVLAYAFLLEAREAANASNNKLELAESFRLEGMILDLSGEHASAIEALDRALNLYADEGSDRVLLVYSTMGNLYMSLRNYEKMLDFGNQYLVTAQRLKSQKDEGTAYFVKGYAQKAMGNYQDAKISLLLAENILSNIDYPFIGNIHNAVAEVHVAEGNLNEALKRLDLAAKADRKVGFKYNQGSYLLLLVEIYKQRGETDLAISELKANLNNDVIQNDKTVLLDVLEQLIFLSEESGNLRAALDYSKQYRDAYKQSFNEQQSQLLALNRVRLAVSEKEETIKLLEKDNQLKEQRNLTQQKQNTLQTYFIIGVICSLGLVITLLMRTRQQRKVLDHLTQDLQKATKAKSDFLARMSHEIRTPLNAIIGLTKLSQRAAENLEQQTNLRQIEGASQTLLRIINDLLDFSKIEAGKLDIESTPFNLDSLVNQTIRLHLAQADEKHIELIQHISRDVPLNLLGDPLRIQQVLSNLVSNALKFTEDGLIAVSIKSDRIDDKVQLKFEVKDTGIGLSQTQQSKLFNPFNQGDESISRRYGGTGLGLAICKQLTALMGGNIWVESQIGKGASFFFTVLVEQDPACKLVSPSKQLSSLRVLVADDISDSRDAICEALSYANIQADVAVGGEDAVAKMRAASAQNEQYDLLILDWNMPDIDGSEVAAITHQVIHKRPPKIIVLYSSESQGMREQGLQLGINSFIKKPFGTSELIDKLQEVSLNINQKSVAKDSTKIPNLSGIKILYAEDNTLNQKVTLGLLKDTHASVTVVNNGQEALAALEKDNAFDLVLMDIQMPVMDGLTAAETIRDKLKLSLPIIAMTAHAMQQDIEKSLAAGMCGHINKPIEPHLFYEVIQNALQKESLKVPGIALPHSPPNGSQPFLTLDEKTLGTIDKNQAMIQFVNDEALYAQVISDFMDLRCELDKLRDAIEKKDYMSIMRISHMYTTALRYIGAYTLAELASAIELAIQNDTDVSSQHFHKHLELFHAVLVTIYDKISEHK